LYFSLEYRYEFKLLYPDNGNKYNIWSQNCNPVIETCAGTESDFGYTPIEIELDSIGSGGFKGLLTSGSYTYLDGNPTGNWWYAVRNLLSLSLSLYFFFCSRVLLLTFTQVAAKNSFGGIDSVRTFFFVSLFQQHSDTHTHTHTHIKQRDTKHRRILPSFTLKETPIHSYGYLTRHFRR
jgi:hypothetical protein